MRLTFRHRGVASAAGLALAAAGLLAVPSAHAERAPAAARPRTQALQRDFAAAAGAFHVPVPVLLAVSYLESRWEGHGGSPATDGGFGMMDLTDVTPAMFSTRGAGVVGRADAASLAAAPAMHTLAAAARLTGAPQDRLRVEDLANLRGGAALLAAHERSLTGGTPSDPADWYGAVALYSRAADQATARRFADEVYRLIAAGAARTTASGQRVRLEPVPGLRPVRRPLPGLRAAAPGQQAADCPPALRCAVLPAAEEGYQRADRPRDGLRIRTIVIHDTETSYDAALRAFQDPADGVAAHYVMRSSDGAVTQLVPARDLAFHSGNYWFNMHSVGIEHEGYAAEGATWYTEAQYRATADLVRYLAARYRIPLDRQHVIGHENVPAPASGSVAGMHWDPGPYWDWTHFMALLGVRAPAAGAGGLPTVGTAVTIAPDFARNEQTVRVCAAATRDGGDPADGPGAGDPGDGSGEGGPTVVCRTQRQPSNFLYVRTAPRASAPLYGDPWLHPAAGRGSDAIDDWGDTVSAGQQFVVAGRSGEWTAIWFSGAEVWFHNPGGVNTVPARGVTVVTPRGATAPVYGQGYPRGTEYPAGVTPAAQAPLDRYTVPSGQAYVADGPPVPADDFSATDPADTVVTGTERYWTVQYGHRLALLGAADVTGRPV